jgi:hypothetical protein
MPCEALIDVVGWGGHKPPSAGNRGLRILWIFYRWKVADDYIAFCVHEAYFDQGWRRRKQGPKAAYLLTFHR